MKKRIHLAFIMFIIMFAILIFKIAFIKTVYGKRYEHAAASQNNYDEVVPASRGRIFDSNNTVLAESVPIYDVILEPIILDSLNETERNTSVSSLSSILEISESTLKNYISKDEKGNLINNTYYLPIAKGISSETARQIEDKNLKGVWLEKKEKRKYPYGTSACHVIGFVNGTNMRGIEKYYNSYLEGKDGRIVKQYNGANLSSVEYYEPENGCDVITTIDSVIQKAAEDAVLEAMEMFPCETASVIVTEPSTGKVLASASSGIFDPNTPSVPLDNPNFNSLSYEEQSAYLNNLWNNYNVSSTFEPGSIFKPMLLCGALDENIISDNSTFLCEGFMQVADRRIHCIKRTGHGSETLEQAVSASCNVSMMDVGLKMGAELFYKYQTDFGFGSKTGIDLPSEVSASSLRYSPEALGPVELATGSIGQSFNCTPIQAITAFNALANGGYIMKPYVVNEIKDSSGMTVYKNEPVKVKQAVSSESCALMKKYLISVVDNGTGKKAKVEGYSIAGKSGTGEQGNRDEDTYTITFAGYFPAEDPKISALVIIDKPKDYADGVTTAAPIFKTLAEKIIDYMNFEPTTVSIETNPLPDFTGYDISDAEEVLTRLGLEFKIVGTEETVVNQFPKGETAVYDKMEVILYTQ